MERRSTLPAADAAVTTDIHFAVERRKVHSIEPFAKLADGDHEAAVAFLDKLHALVAAPKPAIAAARNDTVYSRNPDVEGPMHAFGYSYLEDKLGKQDMDRLRLPRHGTPYGDGGMFAYEALNLVDGTRTVSDVRDWLVAELGPVPVEYVAEYLQALESIKVIRR